MTSPTLQNLERLTTGLAQHAISEAAARALADLPKSHPTRAANATSEALARAWFQHLAGLPAQTTTNIKTLETFDGHII